MSDQLTTTKVQALSLANVKSAVSAAFEQCREAAKVAEEAERDIAFAYDDAAGNKAARSHVAKLRSIKGEIERTRKATKDAGLQFCRMVDEEAKDVVSVVESIIAPHQSAIDEVANRHRLRLEQMQSIINAVSMPDMAELRTLGIGRVQAHIEQVESVDILPEVVFERTAEAKTTKAATLASLRNLLADLQREAAERAELERLRAEAAERQRQEELRKAAEQAAERERIAAEQKAKEMAELVERQKREAERRAAEELDRVKAEAQRKEQKAREQAEAAKKREADAKAQAERQAKQIAELKRQQAEAEEKRIKEQKEREAAKLAALSERKNKAVEEVRAFLAQEKGRGVPELVEAIANGTIKTLILA